MVLAEHTPATVQPREKVELKPSGTRRPRRLPARSATSGYDKNWNASAVIGAGESPAGAFFRFLGELIKRG